MHVLRLLKHVATLLSKHCFGQYLRKAISTLNLTVIALFFNL